MSDPPHPPIIAQKPARAASAPTRTVRQGKSSLRAKPTLGGEPTITEPFAEPSTKE